MRDIMEKIPLLQKNVASFEELKSGTESFHTRKLSVFYTTLCIVDLFGVFPIIALPKAVICCGWFGIPLVIFVFGLQIYTSIVLGKCWIIAEKIDPDIIRKSRYPYAVIAEVTYGRYMSILVAILIDITVFGAGIPNLLVASQNLQLIGSKMSYQEFDFSFCYWLIIIGIFLCPIMWLGSPRNMKSLAVTSVFTVLTVSIMTWFCILSDRMTIPRDIDPPSYLRTGLPPLQNILLAYGIIAFQFDVHPALLTIQVDMKDKTKIGHAVSGAILVTGTMFAVTAGLGALRYGGNLKSNILESLPGSFPLYLVIILVTLQLCLSNAISSSPLYQHIEDYLNIPREFNSKRMLLRSCLIALAVIIGETVPEFDLVMQLIGGTLTGPLMFILPPLFYTKMRRLEKIYDEKYEKKNKRENEQVNTSQSIGHVSIKSDNKMISLFRETKSLLSHFCSNYFIATVVVVLGLCATLTATYFSFKNVIELANFAPPCLFNISSLLK